MSLLIPVVNGKIAGKTGDIFLGSLYFKVFLRLRRPYPKIGSFPAEPRSWADSKSLPQWNFLYGKHCWGREVDKISPTAGNGLVVMIQGRCPDNIGIGRRIEWRFCGGIMACGLA